MKYEVTLDMGHKIELEADWFDCMPDMLTFWERDEAYANGKLVAAFVRWDSVVQVS